MSLIHNMASDVATFLTGEGYTTTVDFVPQVDVASIRTRKLYVVPVSISFETETRACSSKVAHLVFIWAEKIEKTDIDNRLATADSIVNLLLRRSLEHGIITECNYSWDADLLSATNIIAIGMNITARLYD